MLVRIIRKFLVPVFNPNRQKSCLRTVTFYRRVLCQHTQNEPDLNYSPSGYFAVKAKSIIHVLFYNIKRIRLRYMELGKRWL